MTRMMVWALLGVAMLNGSAAYAQEARGEAYSLDGLIAKALVDSPRLKGMAFAFEAAEGARDQAGVFPNPEVGVQAENIAGQGPYRGTDAAEITYGVSQLIELGGKISAREQIAGQGREVARLEYQGTALDVIRDVTIAYATAVAAAENVALATEQEELAGDVLKSVSVRVNAAAAPLIQKSRAEVEGAMARIARDRAQREREIALMNLAALLGMEGKEIRLEKTAFYVASREEQKAEVEALKATPDMVRLAHVREQSEARLALEKANAIPDPRVNVGMRDLRNTGDQAFVVGVSVPLPILNANGGNIRRAHGEVARTEQENRQAALVLATELNRAQEMLENAYLQAETLKKEILPSAGKAFSLAREGYGLGRFPYLEVLDAQRSLFSAKQQHIQALKEFHTAKAQVERLTAVHRDMIKAEGASHEE